MMMSPDRMLEQDADEDRRNGTPTMEEAMAAMEEAMSMMQQAMSTGKMGAMGGMSPGSPPASAPRMSLGNM